MPKTWKQKFESGKPPHVDIADKAMMGIEAGARMLIADPLTVREYVRRIPKGKAMTIPELRAEMAKAFEADTTCPLTTGIFLRIVSECALEDLAAGASLKDITPFWRVVDTKSGVAKKLSCGVERIRELRAMEGLD